MKTHVGGIFILSRYCVTPAGLNTTPPSLILTNSMSLWFFASNEYVRTVIKSGTPKQ